MRLAPLSGLLALTLAAGPSFASLTDAQTAAKPVKPAPSSTKKPPGKVTAVVKKLADTAATAAAGMAVDTLLGEKGRAVAGALAGTAAGVAGGSCPPGTVAVPINPPGAAALAGIQASAGAAVVGAAKQALKSKAAAEAAAQVATVAAGQAAAGLVCQPIPAAGATPGTAGTQVPGASAVPVGLPGGMGALAAMTPVGMAASVAPGAIKGLKGMFGGKPMDKIAMLRELGKGRLELKGVKFIEGTAELEPGFEPSFAALGEALPLSEGTYLLHVAAEQAKGAVPDTGLARKRLEKVWAAILVNGVPEQRVIAAAVLPVELQQGRKAPKPGDARIELIRFAGTP